MMRVAWIGWIYLKWRALVQKLAAKLVWSSICNLIQGWVWVIWKGVFVLVVLIVFVSFL